jgi:hypothetical protein
MTNSVALALLIGICLGSGACGRTPEPTPAVADQAAVVDCSEAASKAKAEPDAFCDVLCSVPGGVEECPVGVPCRERPQRSSIENVQNPVERSLCERRNAACERER